MGEKTFPMIGREIATLEKKRKTIFIPQPDEINNHFINSEN
jgi:hypothetical protein